MSSKFRNALIAFGGTMLVVLSFIGTIGASLSWFTYTKMIALAYNGTSISSNKLLQVGIVTDLDLTSDNFTCDGGIAWTAPGSGISPDQVNAYLSQTGYASTSLAPTTSKKYATGDSLNLTRSPYDFDPNNPEEARLSSYAKIPFAFRIINVADGDYVANRNVWITQADVNGQQQSGFTVANGIRAHFDSSLNKFILNPSKTEKGYTQVAGPLDLNNDGYYDCWTENKEIIYGDYSGTPTYSEPLEEDSELDDIYGTGKDNAYSFLAAHKAGNCKVTNMSSLTLNKQEYLTINEVCPEIDDLGNFKNGIPVCNTGSEKVAFTTMTIWAEGWDTEIVDEIARLKFNFSITFEIDKV